MNGLRENSQHQRSWLDRKGDLTECVGSIGSVYSCNVYKCNGVRGFNRVTVLDDYSILFRTTLLDKLQIDLSLPESLAYS